MPVHFYNPSALIWLWLVPAMAALLFHAAVKRRLALRIFGTIAALVSRKREAIGNCLAVVLVILALARPAWNLEERQLQETGRDVIFLLDVSRSMQADDMHPNRLETAKTAILDCIETLSGDRVGLVLFAGSAEIRCPLTADYDYFRMALRQASPESVSLGGTMIANAIEKTLDRLIDSERAGLQDIILITDGEDMVEGADEVDAARLLANSGVRLIAIGIGDRSRGSRIAFEDEESGARLFLKYKNREVWTRLHSETLRKMVSVVTDGTYFEVEDGPFNLTQIYGQVMEYAQRSSTGQQTVERYKERFPVFLGAAVLVLLLTHRWRRIKGLHVMFGLLLLAGAVQANPAALFREGNRAYEEGRFDDAVDRFQKAAEDAPESAEIHYNLGNALYKSGNFEEARGLFEYAASQAQTEGMRSRCWYNLGNCLIQTSTALRSEDSHAALAYCRQATLLYRAAIDGNDAFPDAAYNLEVSLRMATAIDGEIRKQQAEQKQNDLLAYIREKIKEFIDRQSLLIEAKETGEAQESLEQETRMLARTVEESGLHQDLEIQDGTPTPGPLTETYEHVLKASDAMAVPDQPTALDELVAALGAVPESSDQQGSGEEESQDTDDYDMEYEESDGEASLYEEGNPFGDFSEYEEIHGVPPPNKSEMDILAEEVLNQEQRKQKAGEYKAVDKDW